MRSQHLSGVLAELDKLDAALVPEATAGCGVPRRPSPASRAAHAAPRARRGSAGWPDLLAIVATFALIHGGGGGVDWHLVVPEFRERGHQAVAVDLPSDDESAGQVDYADAVVDAVGYRSDLVVVGHSSGASLRQLVCARVPVDLVVLLAAMIPAPGELFSDWWTNTGYREVRGRPTTTISLQSSLPRRDARMGREFPGAAPAVANADVAGGPDVVLNVP